MISLLLLLAAQDWPGFRGPAGQNVTDDKTLPLTWGPTENLLWTSPLPAVGHASPIVVGGRVIVCGVKWEGGKADPAVIPEHHVTAYAADDGKKLWDAVLPPGPWRREDFRSGPGGGYAAPTPCSDGRRVFAAFSSSVIAAYELDGTLAWRKEIKPHTFDVTLGSSPVLFGETVVLLCAMAKASDSRLLALRKSDGEPAWETRLPKTGFGHSTPLLIDVKGKPQLLVVASGGSKTAEALQSFDPSDGRRLWWCKGAGDASSPAYGDGLVYFDSGRGSDGAAVEPGEGELAPKWTAGPLSECIASPLIVNGHVFRLQGSGVVKVWKLSDGAEAGKKRLEKLGSTWSSPLLDGNGRLYFASGGRSVVVKADPSLEEVGAGDLGDANHASPAVSKGRLYLLGQKNLYCVGAR
jgi:outer membrane protein assembly factor BamB